MDLKRNPTDHGRTNCAGEIWRKKSFGYRNENQKTSDLDSADCVAKICWIIVPAAKSEEFFSVGSHVRNLCMWDLWDFAFFILNLFKYFVDFLFRSAWCVWNLICFGHPDLKKRMHPHQQYSRIYVFALGCPPPHSGTFLWVRTDAIWYSSELKQPCWHWHCPITSTLTVQRLSQHIPSTLTVQ